MTVSIENLWHNNKLEIQGGNQTIPDSVFISSSQEFGEFCIEVDRRTFLDAIKQEFGLVEESEQLEAIFALS